LVVKVTKISYLCILVSQSKTDVMVHESLIYKEIEIKIVQKEDDEYFRGCYVKTLWFSDIDHAKVFIDKMTAHQEMSH